MTKKPSKATAQKLAAKKSKTTAESSAPDPGREISVIGGEEQIYCQKDFLAILGTAGTLGAAPYEDKKYEIWGVAQCATFPVFKRADILFELHTKDYWGDENVRSRLNQWGGRLVMQDHYDDVPKSEKFPVDTILGKYRKYHRTSITYMLALAYHSFLMTGKPFHVGLFGIHMEDVNEEYAEQRPCCEYWLGRMEGAGMDTFIAGGAVLAAPFLYGYEKYNSMVWKLRQRRDGLSAGVQVRQQEHQQKAMEVHEQIGAVKECEYWMRLAQRGELSEETLAAEIEKET